MSEQLSTTTFIEEAVVNTTSYSTTEAQDNYPINYQGIADFLKKPLLLTVGTWSTGTGQNNDIYTVDVGSTMMANTYWKDKIEGFGLVRGDVVFRVMLNANPFQSGRLLCHFVPQYTYRSGTLSTAFYSMYCTYLESKTMHPMVELDCRDGACEMRIPYVSPTEYYNIANGKYDWGTFFITVLSPLVTGSAGETAAQFSVYMHFENFELAAPTVTQSGGPPSKRFSAKKISSIATEPQGRVSSLLTQGASIAASLTTVPLLAAYAGVANVALSAAANVASAFGYSKPLPDKSPIVVMNQLTRYSHNADGVDSAQVLALDSTQAVDVMCENSLTDKDEMAFEHLKRIPAYVLSHNWSTSDATGTTLIAMDVCPSDIAGTHTVTKGGRTLTAQIGPPAFYLSKLFSFWRGSMVVNIKIPKTVFHTGRLQVTWTPNYTTTVPTNTTALVALREIIDVRLGDEFTLKLPYLSPYNYLETNNSSGRLVITVLNELRAPETASATLQMLLFFSGGEDFELASPVGTYGSATVQVPVSLESGDIVTESIGDGVQSSFSTITARQSIGEMFRSVKQLTGRYSQIQQASTDVTNAENLCVYPWTAPVPYSSSIPALQADNYGGTMYTYISLMYAFQRGGMKLLIMPTDLTQAGVSHPNTPSAPMLAINYPGVLGSMSSWVYRDSGSYPFSSATPNNWPLGSFAASAVAIQDGQQGYMSIKLPYQAQTRCSFVYPSSQNTNPGPNVDPSQPVAVAAFSCTAFTLSTFTLAMATAEDFQLSYFIGCPPLFVSYV